MVIQLAARIVEISPRGLLAGLLARWGSGWNAGSRLTSQLTDVGRGWYRRSRWFSSGRLRSRGNTWPTFHLGCLLPQGQRWMVLSVLCSAVYRVGCFRTSSRNGPPADGRKQSCYQKQPGPGGLQVARAGCPSAPFRVWDDGPLGLPVPQVWAQGSVITCMELGRVGDRRTSRLQANRYEPVWWVNNNPVRDRGRGTERLLSQEDLGRARVAARKGGRWWWLLQYTRDGRSTFSSSV